VWVDYLRKPSESLRGEINGYIDDERLSTCGVVIAELLQGALNEDDFSELTNNLRGLHCLEADPSIYIEAGRLSYELIKKGRTIPLTDVLIAVLAIRHGQTLWTRDVHFKNIPSLRLK
jgi:hypothetical protein